jgi:pentatricopeptide repeat protein
VGVELAQLHITTLRHLVSKGEEVHRKVQHIFEEICKNGNKFAAFFSEVKVALSPENCGDTHTDSVNRGLTWSFSTQTTGKHWFTRKLLFGNARSPAGNPALQSKYNKEHIDYLPGSTEQNAFTDAAEEQFRSLADCPKAHLRQTSFDPGCIMLHFEVLPSVHYNAEEAAAKYITKITAMASEPSPAIDPLNLMPKETLQVLGETGALDTFAPLPAQKEVGDEEVIWQHADQKISCTVVRYLGKGAQGWVYEIKSPLVEDGQTRALKCATFSATIHDVCVMLRLNSRHSHPNVLKVDSVYSPIDSLQLLYMMELIDGPKEGVRDLAKAMGDGKGLLYSGSREVVEARLLSLVAELAFAIEYVHSCGVVHQDIKPANILIDASKIPIWRLVLTDFGISSLGEQSKPGEIIGAKLRGCTPMYCSKEVYDRYCCGGEQRKQECTSAADLWCFASTVVQMYSYGKRTIPVRTLDENAIDEMLSELIPPNGLMPVGLSKILRRLLLSSDTDRMSSKQLVDEIIVGLPETPTPIVSRFERPDKKPGIEAKRLSIIHSNLGLALQSRGRLLEAHQHYERAIQADRSHIQTLKCSIVDGRNQQQLLLLDGWWQQQGFEKEVWVVVQAKLRRMRGADRPIGCSISPWGVSGTERATGRQNKGLHVNIIRASLWDQLTQAVVVTDVGFLQVLRDEILSGKFESDLTEQLQEQLRESIGGCGFRFMVDKTHFAEMYERSMLMLSSLTPHQAQKLKECLEPGALLPKKDVHIRAPAGCGKTFLALHLMLRALNAGVYVLFVAQNQALACFVAKWLVARTEDAGILSKFHMLCEEQHTTEEHVEPSENLKRAYHVVMLECMDGGQWEQALALLEEMKEREGIEPDENTYNIVISACEEGGQWKQALALLEEMKEREGIQPDTRTYNVVISACIAGGQQALVLAVQAERNSLAAQEQAEVKATVQYAVAVCCSQVMDAGLERYKLVARKSELADAYVIDVHPFRQQEYTSSADFEYGLLVVDEAHHVYAKYQTDFADQYLAKTADGKPKVLRLLLSDISQSSSLSFSTGNQDMVVVELAEVVRSSQRIVEGARSFQTNDRDKEATRCHHPCVGSPLQTYLFERVLPRNTIQSTSTEQAHRYELYAVKLLEALNSLTSTFQGLDFFDRVAVIMPDEEFILHFKTAFMCEQCKQQKVHSSPFYNFLNATELATWGHERLQSRRDLLSDQYLVLDTVDNFNGLERLIVIAVGLDEDRNTPLQQGLVAGTTGDGNRHACPQTRSMIYRAITRAQMAVIVVNEVLVGGWLEFLTCIIVEDEFDVNKARAANIPGVVTRTIQKAQSKVVSTRPAAKPLLQKASTSPTERRTRKEHEKEQKDLDQRNEGGKTNQRLQKKEKKYAQEGSHEASGKEEKGEKAEPANGFEDGGDNDDVQGEYGRGTRSNVWDIRRNTCTHTRPAAVIAHDGFMPLRAISQEDEDLAWVRFWETAVRDRWFSGHSEEQIRMVNNYFCFLNIWRNLLPKALELLFKERWLLRYAQRNDNGSPKYAWKPEMGDTFVGGSPLFELDTQLPRVVASEHSERDCLHLSCSTDLTQQLRAGDLIRMRSPSDTTHLGVQPYQDAVVKKIAFNVRRRPTNRCYFGIALKHAPCIGIPADEHKRADPLVQLGVEFLRTIRNCNSVREEDGDGDNLPQVCVTLLGKDIEQVMQRNGKPLKHAYRALIRRGIPQRWNTTTFYTAMCASSHELLPSPCGHGVRRHPTALESATPASWGYQWEETCITQADCLAVLKGSDNLLKHGAGTMLPQEEFEDRLREARHCLNVCVTDSKRRRELHIELDQIIERPFRLEAAESNYFCFLNLWRNLLPKALATFFKQRWLARYPQCEWKSHVGAIFVGGSLANLDNLSGSFKSSAHAHTLKVSTACDWDTQQIQKLNWGDWIRIESEVESFDAQIQQVTFGKGHHRIRTDEIGQYHVGQLMIYSQELMFLQRDHIRSYVTEIIPDRYGGDIGPGYICIGVEQTYKGEVILSLLPTTSRTTALPNTFNWLHTGDRGNPRIYRSVSKITWDIEPLYRLPLNQKLPPGLADAVRQADMLKWDVSMYYRVMCGNSHRLLPEINNESMDKFSPLVIEQAYCFFQLRSSYYALMNGTRISRDELEARVQEIRMFLRVCITDDHCRDELESELQRTMPGIYL